MRISVVYGFASGQVAMRFLNRLKSGDIEGVKARLYKGATTVEALYDTRGDSVFDETCSQLDELAASLGGWEESI